MCTWTCGSPSCLLRFYTLSSSLYACTVHIRDMSRLPWHYSSTSILPTKTSNRAALCSPFRLLHINNLVCQPYHTEHIHHTAGGTSSWDSRASWQRNGGEISTCVCVCVKKRDVYMRRHGVKYNYGCLCCLCLCVHMLFIQSVYTHKHVHTWGFQDQDDWFVYIDRREDEECMSAALPCFGVACAVFTADYTGPQFCLDSSFSGVCVCVCLIFVLLIVCVCVFCP